MIRYILLLFIIFSAACTPRGDGGVEGVLLFGDRPLSEAQVEIYLKDEKDRSTLPFAVVATDEMGHYRVELPPGRYFIIGKKREETNGGLTRMLMAESPANPVEVSDGIRTIPPFPLREMGRDGALVPEPGTGVSGRVTSGGEPVSGAFVYVYTEEVSGLMGPSYGEAVQTAADGSFHIPLPAGRFYLAARLRHGGSRIGEPDSGDLNGSYPENPVEVPLGKIVILKSFPLDPVDPHQRNERMEKGKFERTKTSLVGRVVNEDVKPVKGIYVFAYMDSRMVGKPTYISAPSDEDGRFTLYLGDGGTYFVGARSAFGGPLEPGEWVGTFDGRADHGTEIPSGANRDLGDIVVREVW